MPQQIPQEPPMYNGLGGKVWQINLEALRQKYHPGVEDATVALYLIHCPGAHLLWDFYTFYIMHLRPIANCQPPKIYLDGATHEIGLFALDPDWPIDITGNVLLAHRLEPTNFAAQFKAASDADAVRYCLRSLVDITDGVLSPDTDYIKIWAERFNSSMLKKH